MEDDSRMLAAVEGSGLAYPTLPQVWIYCFNPGASEKEELGLAGVEPSRGEAGAFPFTLLPP